jgi:hypothetical protein
LNGITILNQYAQTTTHFNTALMLILGLGIFLVFTIIAFLADEPFFVLVGGFMGIIAVFIVAVSSTPTPTGKQILQVTIADTVSMIEFYNKYEILKQEGQIYTIVEKTQ